MAGIPVQHFKVARVLGEDEKFLTVEIAKTDDVEFVMSEDASLNRFLTVLFSRDAGDGNRETYVPWEDE